jgi:hypothetical protein
MKIKEQSRLWLPKDADQDDVVTRATLTPGATRHLMLAIRKNRRVTDAALLILPRKDLHKALAAINKTPGLTLREIGELEI